MNIVFQRVVEGFMKKRIAGALALTALITGTSTAAELGYCYPCLMQTTGNDGCRYFEYKTVFLPKEASYNDNPCQITGQQFVSQGGTIGWYSTGRFVWPRVSRQACERNMANKARGEPPALARAQCFRTYLDGIFFARSRR